MMERFCKPFHFRASVQNDRTCCKSNRSVKIINFAVFVCIFNDVLLDAKKQNTPKDWFTKRYILSDTTP
jgi:hypothetical protein